MTLPPDPAVRRLALAVAVLHDVDLDIVPDGLVLGGRVPLALTWTELAAAAAPAALDEELARWRLLRHLRGRRALADLEPGQLAATARPVGFPTMSRCFPGPGWGSVRVLGGALDLGVGYAGVVPDDADLLVLSPACCAAAGVEPPDSWPAAQAYLERMGELAARRSREQPGAPLRPMGDCDVVTLLGAAAFRAELAAGDGTGMRAVAVPMRTRGWVDLSRIDPAFVVAAAAATTEPARGFPRPLLVTADEVVCPPPGGRSVAAGLADGAAPHPVLPAVRWR